MSDVAFLAVAQVAIAIDDTRKHDPFHWSHLVGIHDSGVLTLWPHMVRIWSCQG